MPGTCLGHFFSGSTDSESEAASPLTSEERCDRRHREYSTFERSNCASRNEFAQLCIINKLYTAVYFLILCHPRKRINFRVTDI